jgi:hypothetical protein
MTPPFGISAAVNQSTPRFALPLTLSLALCAISLSALNAQTIGGAVIGLAGSNLMLTETYNANGVIGSNTKTFSWNTLGLPNFTFPDGILPNGTTYNVTISSLPSNLGQMCAITGGSGTVGTGNPANGSVIVYCYNVSGTVSGLPPGQSVTLQNNLGTPLQISSNGVFLFPPAIVSGAIAPNGNTGGANYSVTLYGSRYSWGTCSVVSGSGTADANLLQPHNSINSVWVICQADNAPQPPPLQWTALTNLPKDHSGNVLAPGTMLLLPDGSVLINGPANGNQPQEWLRLLPDNRGHYVNGTWTTVPDSICPHGYYASQVMSNGKLFIAGGEYPGPGHVPPGCTGLIDTEIFDPSVLPGGMPWTAANPPTNLINPANPTPFWCPSGTNQGFLDMISETLLNGSVLMAPVCPQHCGDTLVYSPSTGWAPNALSLANTGGTDSTGWSCSQQEDTWVKLQDGSILTADPPSPPAQSGSPQTHQTSERFVPSLNAWVPEANLEFALYDTEAGWSGGGETGPAFLLPAGKAIFIGGSPVMGIYDPVANAWSQSPIAPNGPATGGELMAGFDSPGAMMVNGKILLTLGFAATPYNLEPGPAFFYEYDPTQGTYTEVLGPGNSGAPSIWTDCNFPAMLDLPDGTVLMDCSGYGGANPQLYVYTPTGSPLPLGQPQVQSVSAAGGGCGNCYLLTGAGLNGISEGASYGDDAQMATDFPIVQLTDGSGNVAYARTYDWSSTSIAPGAPGSTYFQVPTGFGPCDLQVVGNGNPSPKVSFTHDCFVPPTVIALCNPPCALGSAVVWSRPNPLRDPWLDGVSVTLLTSDPEATELAGDEQLFVDTQTLLKPEVARQVVIAPAVSGTGSALIVGPTIEMRSRKAGDQRAHHTNAHVLAGMISIPYEPRGLAREGKVRIVQFDDQHRRWVSIPGNQKVDESKHLVTAAISEVGKFTVVAEIRLARPRN